MIFVWYPKPHDKAQGSQPAGGGASKRLIPALQRQKQISDFEANLV